MGTGLNNDGRNDVVVATSSYFDPDNDYHIHVFLQNVSGELDSPVKYSAGNGESIDIGDVNNDNLNDIAVSYGGNRPDSKIGVFL